MKDFSLQMLAKMSSMEQAIEQINRGPMGGSEEPTAKKRKTCEEREEDDAERELSDGQNLLQTTEPAADSATRGSTTGAQSAQLEHDALLSEISQDFHQEEDLGPDINQQLADIINKRWSTKLNEAKMKETKKYHRPANCDKLIVPRVNTEIWDKLDNKTKHHDLRATSLQKSLAKAGAILAQFKTKTFKACQLASKLNEWQRITSDPEILCTVRGDKIEFSISSTHNLNRCGNHQYSSFLQLSIQHMRSV